MKPARNPDHSSWNSLRWKGITRPYTHTDIDRLKGSVHVEHTIARAGAEKFWQLLKNESFVAALGAISTSQAVEMAHGGLKAVFISACEQNEAGGPFSPARPRGGEIADSVRSANRALLRADQAAHSRRDPGRDWMLPIVAQGDTGADDPMGAFESTRHLIESGASAIYFSDGQPNHNSCKTLIPLEDMIQKLVAARMAADTLGIPTVIIARTDAESATYLISDHDCRDHQFLNGHRSIDGKYMYRGGLQAAIDRALALAPYADVLWCEFRDLNKEDARRFAEAIHAYHPDKLLAYNCSPSFHWRAKMNEEDIVCFQRDLAAMGFRFQFITLAGYHMLNLSMYQFAKDYCQSGMAAYSQLQELELDMAKQLGHTPRPAEASAGELTRLVSSALTGSSSDEGNPNFHKEYIDTLDYNDPEATERTPMPHLYPPRPMAAAAD